MINWRSELVGKKRERKQACQAAANIDAIAGQWKSID